MRHLDTRSPQSHTGRSMKRAYHISLAAFPMALVGVPFLAPTTAAAAAASTQATPANLVCTHTNGCGEPQPYPVECDDLTAADAADWWNYLDNGVPLPNWDLPYVECFGF